MYVINKLEHNNLRNFISLSVYAPEYTKYNMHIRIVKYFRDVEKTDFHTPLKSWHFVFKIMQLSITHEQ
jgi:hypothetical protein